MMALCLARLALLAIALLAGRALAIPVEGMRVPFEAPTSTNVSAPAMVLAGCTDSGACYTPQRQSARVVLAAAETEGVLADAAGGGALSKLRRLAGEPEPEPEFLPVERAFQVTVRARDADTLVADFSPAPGYYLYRDKVSISLPPGSGAKVAEVRLPRGEVKSDPNFGDTEVWHAPVQALVTLERKDRQQQTVQVEVGYQGCADAGLCYPPEKKRLDVVLPAYPAASTPARTAVTKSAAPSVGEAAPAAATTAVAEAEPAVRPAPPADVGAPAGPSDESSQIARLLDSGNFWLAIASFFGFGVLLSFTPCAFPMVPILSGIIVGHGHPVTRSRAFALTCIYVLGMAITYALAGVAAGLSGVLLASLLQSAWVLGAFAALFVVLSLSMFGLYDLQLPANWQSRLSGASNHLPGGSFWGVLLMGVLSALIVGPCVAAPLAGALLYINQSRDAVLGGSALFAMALGMGVPLLAVGLSAGALLPRAGAWMQTVKNFVGVVLLGLAIWIISPLIPAVFHMLLWAVLLICSAVYLHAIDPLPHNASGVRKLWKGLGVIALLLGVALLIGALSGGRDLLQPLSGLRGAGAGAAQPAPAFVPVSSVTELERALATAEGRPAMLDFYADWCISCKEMERFTFTDPRVRERMDRMLLLRADVTRNTADDLVLLRRFRLFGPPGIIFFDPAGNELPTRVVGFQPAERFVASLDAALQGR